MREYLQPIEKSAREDFYQIMLLKYKREVLKKEKINKEEEAKEIERILNLENKKYLQNRKGIFATKQKIGNVYNSWVNNSSLPKNNLAYSLRDKNKYELDGGVAQQAELGATEDDQMDRLADLNDYVSPGEEDQMQLDLEKTRKELKKRIKEGAEKYKEAQKGAKTAKTAKSGAEAVKVAKAAKTGAEVAKATKVAKTVKTLKTVLNITKVITLGAAIETICISLLVTVIIWFIQIIGAHLMKSKYIPRMSKWDWAGFGLLMVPSFIAQAIPIIILITAIYVDTLVLGAVLEFLKMFIGASIQVIKGIVSLRNLRN